MASKKFMDALNLLIEEKGIEKDVFLEMLKESIGKAYKKNYLTLMLMSVLKLMKKLESLDYLNFEQLLMI